MQIQLSVGANLALDSGTGVLVKSTSGFPHVCRSLVCTDSMRLAIAQTARDYTGVTRPGGLSKQDETEKEDHQRKA